MAEVLAPENQQYFAPSSLRRSPPSSTFLVGSPNSLAGFQHPYSEHRQSETISSSSSSCPPSLHSSHVDLPQAASLISTPSTAFSLESSSESDEELSFPSYDDDTSSDHSDDEDRPISSKTSEPSGESNTTPTNTPEFLLQSEDDTAVRDKPTRHVDYLSHDWQEEDIWASWRHIVSQRKVYGEQSRLENASWRTWAKQKHRLKTIPPEKLNWYDSILPLSAFLFLTPFQVERCRCNMALWSITVKSTTI